MALRCDTPTGDQLKPRRCRHCDDPFWPQQRSQEFCCTEHRQAFHNTRIKRGLAVLDLAMDWINGDKSKLTEMSQVLRDFRDQDRARDRRYAEMRRTRAEMRNNARGTA